MAKGFILNLFEKGVSKDVFIPSNDEAVLKEFAKDFLDGKRILFEKLDSKEEARPINPVYDKATLILKNNATKTSLWPTLYVNSHHIDDKDLDTFFTNKNVNGLLRDDVRTTLYQFRRYKKTK